MTEFHVLAKKRKNAAIVEHISRLSMKIY